MKTCLIIDDVEVSRYTARTFLEDIGYAVAEAEDSAGALDAMARDSIDVVLLDWHLRKKSSLDLLATLRERYPRVPVVMFSGVEGQEKAAQARDAGAVDFILKPTTREKIEAAFLRLGLQGRSDPQGVSPPPASGV